MFDFNISLNNKNITLPPIKVTCILKEIGKLNGKEFAHIRSGLYALYANKPNELIEKIWLIATRGFPSINQCLLLGIDLEQSQSLFEQISQQMPDNPAMRTLFDKAVASFNQMIDSRPPIKETAEVKEAAATTEKVEVIEEAEVELSQFEKDLASWVADPLAIGRKDEVADRIRTAFYKNQRELDLNLKSLNKLPSCIGKLSQLMSLNLSNNSLDSLPSGIEKLTQLITLKLKHNDLSSFPVELCQLPLLRVLDLSHNQIESLPPEIRQISQLRSLNLENNNLKSLPVEIGQLTLLLSLWLMNNNLESLPFELEQLTNLINLGLFHNRNLRDLPLRLGQIPGLTILRIDNTGIREEMRDAILAQCKALRRDSEAEQILLTRLQSWKAASRTNANLNGVKGFSVNEKELINLWLVRLEMTKDYNGTSQAALARTVCQMLEDLGKNHAFRELFFDHVTANLEHREDRVAMALKEIYTSWQLSQLDDMVSIDEKLQIMTRGAKTLALRKAILHRIDQHQKEFHNIENEYVEIYLYYEIALKDALNLLSVIGSMSYEECGQRNWIDEASLIEEVNHTYLDYLIELPAFEKMIESDEDFKRVCKEMTQPIEEELTALLDSEPKGANQHDDEYPDWVAEIRALQAQRNDVISKSKRNYALEKLNCSTA